MTYQKKLTIRREKGRKKRKKELCSMAPNQMLGEMLLNRRGWDNSSITKYLVVALLPPILEELDQNHQR